MIELRKKFNGCDTISEVLAEVCERLNGKTELHIHFVIQNNENGKNVYGERDVIIAKGEKPKLATRLWKN